MRLSPLQSGAGYVLVVQDLTDRKRDEDRLQTQNDRLREFTGVLSHDLRSPLTVLSGSLERYRETGDPAALDTIEETTERMDRLIEDLLRIARHGEDLVDPEPTDLLPVIEVAKRGTCPDSNPLRYEQVPQLSADSDRLCQLFENLFRNVREHAGPDARIRIGPLEDGFYVADDGPGIDADVAEQVFEHGYSTAEQGTGFGLSLVRRFATAHDWDVGVDENAVGGAMFRFTGVEFVD
jgi:signal transduction histidine kinase